MDIATLRKDTKVFLQVIVSLTVLGSYGVNGFNSATPTHCFLPSSLLSYYACLVISLIIIMLHCYTGCIVLYFEHIPLFVKGIFVPCLTS